MGGRKNPTRSLGSVRIVQPTVIRCEPGKDRDGWVELLELADETVPLRAALQHGVLYGVIDTDTGRSRQLMTPGAARLPAWSRALGRPR